MDLGLVRSPLIRRFHRLSGNSMTDTFVDGSDFASTRDNPRNFLNHAPFDFPYGYSRGSFVDGSELPWPTTTTRTS